MQRAAHKAEILERYAAQPRRVRWPLLAGLVLLHTGALYVLAYALVTDMARSVEGEVMAAFTIAPTEADPAPPPLENRSEPEQGEQGAPAETAVAAPESAPQVALPLPKPDSLPQAASTGEASLSGARAAGKGTGASGNGLGTGSGLAGSGPGGIAVTRPEHISGAIDNARDYPTPPGGREARRGTHVIVRVIVGPDGRARDCSIYRASPDAQADRITCQLVVDRLGFRPARDPNGNPVDAPFYWRQRWF